MLTFKQHFEEVAGKVTSRVSLIRRLAGTTWRASAKTLRISAQAMYSLQLNNVPQSGAESHT